MPHHVGVLILPLELVRVRGRSMVPTFAEGDLLVVTSRFVLGPGQAVIVDLPPDRSGASRPRSVKRLLRRDPADSNAWWIDSDNAAEGVTSFDIGPLPSSAIHAVVVARLPRPLSRLLGR